MVFHLYVDGICIKEGKILLAKRACHPFKGFWHVIGGEVRKNVTFSEALKREFKDETNLDVEIGNALGWRISESFDRKK